MSLICIKGSHFLAEYDINSPMLKLLGLFHSALARLPPSTTLVKRGNGNIALGQPCRQNNECEGNPSLYIVVDYNVPAFYMLNSDTGVTGRCRPKEYLPENSECANHADLPNIIGEGLTCLSKNS
jgi:hypothetical protein